MATEGRIDTFGEDASAGPSPTQDAAAPASDSAQRAQGTGPPGGPVSVPRLGAVGWLRWGWRQLTSMRTALLLLMLLAVAAVPGSVFPQRPQDPARVAQYLLDNPGLGPWLDRLGFFDVYASVWFSAIYLLLFVSLVGCIVPRTRVHLRALRFRPPSVPRRLDRFPAHAEETVAGEPEEVAAAAAGSLRGSGRLRAVAPRYRVEVTGSGQEVLVSAERGYLKETGNLVFHLCLLGLLLSVAAGQLLHYRGQAIVVEGHGFANARMEYDTFEAGRAFDPSGLDGFTLTLDSFTSEFTPDGAARARDFQADVTVTEPGEDPYPARIRVNSPLRVGGAKVYLQGNGYAPHVQVRDGAGAIAFDGPVVFLPQDAMYTSRGVVKVPDVAPGDPQLGFNGFLLPTAVAQDDGYVSVYPQPLDPVLVLDVYAGDLGLDTGVPQNVYQLDVAGLDRVVGADGEELTIAMTPGQSVELPDGLGSITFTGLSRFVALDLRHDPSLTWVLVFSLGALGGLVLSLFVPRRRVWLRARSDGSGRTVVATAALARGDDTGVQGALDEVMAAVRGTAPDGQEGAT